MGVTMKRIEILSIKLRHFPETDPPATTEKSRQRVEIEAQVAEYLARGLAITEYAAQDNKAAKVPINATQEQMREMKRKNYNYRSRKVLRNT